MPHTLPFEHDDFNDDAELFDMIDACGLNYDPDGYAGEHDQLLDMVCMELEDDSFEDEFNDWMEQNDLCLPNDDDEIPF